MKRMLAVLVVSTIFIWCSASYASFVSGSTGADGAFNPTANTVVTLPPSGIFNYTTVNIPAGVTVTFKQNIANTPVYLLSTSDVTINGTISVNGSNATTTLIGTGGPGGFNGGNSGMSNLPGGKGLGPGGGGIGNSGGAGGGFGSNGGTYDGGTGGAPYGNARLLPLIGGSGGAGRSYAMSGNGGGGGGAILIASSTAITVNGAITANGGNGTPRQSYYEPSGGGGSGGGIKLIANTIFGNGEITALGGSGDGSGGVGRIRFEAYSNIRSAGTNPPYSFGNPGNVFISAPPSLTITSIAGTASPATPTGSYSQPDMLLPNSTINPVTINISANNVPITTTVNVRVIPQYGTDSSYPTTLNGTQQASTGSTSVNLSTTYSNIITAEATFTVVAMYYNGEQIDKVHVAATMGGKSETTYITKSGKKIKGELVAALVR